MISYTFDAIGTGWSIDVLEDLSPESSDELLKKIQARIETFDHVFSRFRPDSVVTKMSQQSGSYTLPKEAEPLIRLYETLYRITDGAVTPLIGNVLSEAGYDAEYSLQPRTLHRPYTWEEVMEYKPPILKMKKPAILDFGAAGKGYLADIVGEVIIHHGVKNFCIDASGDILYKSEDTKPIRIGLEHPENPKQVIGVAELTGGSICGSAGNRRKWGHFHHIINPHTLSSPTDFASVWVIAETAILADALTTCLFFTQPAKLSKYYTFEYVILNKDFTLQTSQDFPGEFFYN